MTRAAERVLAELPDGTEVAVDVPADLASRMEELLAARLAPSSALRVSVRGVPASRPATLSCPGRTDGRNGRSSACARPSSASWPTI
jgi:hypothetical protein